MPTLKYGIMFLLTFIAFLVMSVVALAEDQILIDEDVFNRPLKGGQIVDVRWTSSRKAELTVEGEYSLDNGATWLDSGKKASDKAGRFIWHVPASVDSAQCLFRVIQKREDGSEVSRSALAVPFLIDSTPPTTRPLGPTTNSERYTRVDYQCEDNAGGSGVQTVRLYYRLSGQKVWRSTQQDVDARTPYPIEFPHRGKWDIFLVATDVVGNKTKVPKLSDSAQFVIDIQSGEPLVELMPLKPNYLFGPGDELTIRWKAEDDDLGDYPVTLSCRLSNQSWKVLAQDIKNTGSWVWKIPAENLRVESIKIDVTDATGKTQSKSQRSFIQVDIEAPEARVTGPAEYIPSKGERLRPFRLEHHLDDGAGSGVSSLELYARKKGETQWQKRELKLRSIYEKVPFDEDDGQYELSLVATDRAGNKEKAPLPSDSPELSVIIDRKAPEVVITSLKEEGGNLAVSWQATDANFGSVPVTVEVNGDVKKGLPPSGRVTLPVLRAEASVIVKAIDLAGRSTEASQTWEGEDVSIPLPPARPSTPEVPEDKDMLLAFTSPGGIAQGGSSETLAWNAKNVGEIEASLFQGDQLIETKALLEGTSQLTWTLEGNHLQENYWIFRSADKSWRSPRWIIDREPPKFNIQATEVNQELAVSVQVSDTPAGLAEAKIFWSFDGGENWSDRALTEGANTFTLDLRAGETWFRLSAVDRVGNRLPASAAPDHKFVKKAEPVARVQPQLALSRPTHTIVAPGQENQLSWTGQNIETLRAVLYRSGREIERQELDPAATTLKWQVDGSHLDELYWVFESGGQKWQSERVRVDAQAPTFDLVAPQESESKRISVGITLEDKLSGVEEGRLWWSHNQGQDWSDRFLRSGQQRVELEGLSGEMWLYVSHRDRVGNSREFPSAGTQPDHIVSILVPRDIQLAFSTDGGVIGLKEQTLNWTSDHAGASEARLFRNADQLVQVRQLTGKEKELTWFPEGNHLDTFQWIFDFKDKRFSSRIWQLDREPPKGRLQAPASVWSGAKELTVSVHLEDELAGVAKAELWVSNNPDWDGMRPISLNPTRRFQEVVIPILKLSEKIYVTLSAEDKVGNRIQERANWPLAMIDVRRQPPQVAFVEQAADTVLPGGTPYNLKWTSKNLKGSLTLESLEPTGQWNFVAEIPATQKEYRLTLPQRDYFALKWRLVQKGTVLAQINRPVQVDATPPRVELAVPSRAQLSFPIRVHILDEGPAGYNSGVLWGRRQGDLDWQSLGQFTGPQEFTITRRPGMWEFTASLLDRFGRGHPRPHAGTPPMAITKVEAPATGPTGLQLALEDSAKVLYLGGEKVYMKATFAEVMPRISGSILIKDPSGKILTTLRKPGVFSFTTPRKSLRDWSIRAEYGGQETAPVTLQVDFENPEGQIRLLEPIQQDQWAKVEVLVGDRGPAGVDRFELYRSDDNGVNWVLVAGASERMEFAPQNNAVKLYLRVLDRVGLWSKAEPSPTAEADFILNWQTDPRDVGFDTFVDAGLYRGGRTHEVKWRGLREDAELQYLPGPGMPWIPLSQIKSGETSYVWHLPLENTRGVELRLVGSGGVVLMKTPTPFAIDSTPSRSGLSFLPSDVVRDSVDYTRPKTRLTPSRPGQSQQPLRDLFPPEGSGRERLPQPVPGIDEVAPYDFATYMAAARDAFARSEYGRAARYLESAQRIHDTDAETHDLLAQCYQKMHREESMIVDHLHRSLELNPRNARSWNHLGVLARLRDDKELAQEYFSKALKVEPKAETYLNLGIMNHEEGQVIQARDNFKKVRQALRHDFESGAYKEATWRLAMLYTYSALKDFGEARRYWAQALELFGRDSWQGKRARKWLSEHDTSF